MELYILIYLVLGAIMGVVGILATGLTTEVRFTYKNGTATVEQHSAGTVLFTNFLLWLALVFMWLPLVGTSVIMTVSKQLRR